MLYDNKFHSSGSKWGKNMFRHLFGILRTLAGGWDYKTLNLKFSLQVYCPKQYKNIIFYWGKYLLKYMDIMEN